jgi:uncharacterized membrane protein YoaT (DUF817 family)
MELQADASGWDARIEALTSKLLVATASHGGTASWWRRLLVFGIRQAWVCLFGGLMVALLMVTHYVYPHDAPLPRYDALTLSAVLIQVALVTLKLETWDEVKVILLFHVAGTGMEVVKTAAGSWIYPEFSYLHIGGVPLFTGFMYASVGSYITRSFRAFDLRFSHHPSLTATLALSAAIYGNFFLDHYGIDLRYPLMACVALAFRRCWVHFRIGVADHRMPLFVAFVLIALFIWLAENVGTYSHAWLYPGQEHGWRFVGPAKLGSWFLLTIMSYTIVTLVKRPRAPLNQAHQAHHAH